MYEVTVGRFPKCTCPDFQKGNICKHYLFVMLRVLRLDYSDPLVWQKALLKSEVTMSTKSWVLQLHPSVHAVCNKKPSRWECSDAFRTYMHLMV